MAQNKTLEMLQKRITDLEDELASLNTKCSQNTEQVTTSIVSRKITINNYGRQEDLEELMRPDSINPMLESHKGDVTIFITHTDGGTTFTVWSDTCREEDYLTLHELARHFE